MRRFVGYGSVSLFLQGISVEPVQVLALNFDKRFILGRRDVLQTTQGALLGFIGRESPSSSLISNNGIKADDNDSYSSSSSSQLDQIQNYFQRKQILWKKNDPDDDNDDYWTSLRYGTSTLRNNERIPISSTCPSSLLTPLPSWMDGYWLCNYKFNKVQFPQGRDKFSIKVPGAGLGTCLAIPNVGYNPAPFVQRIIKTRKILDGNNKGIKNSYYGYEDVAYNVPRKFEAFWPQAKVTSIQVAINENRILSPVCRVTGEGCTFQENPYLHDRYATRYRVEFDGPTIGRGFKSQQIDLSLVERKSAYNHQMFVASRNYVQFNVQQQLECYYQEFLSLTIQQPKIHDDDDDRILRGRNRVAAFLPPTQPNQSSLQALAIYDYNMEWKQIDSDEASTI